MYIRSQNYFRGVAGDVAEHMLMRFIERHLPWLLDRIYDNFSWQDLIRRDRRTEPESEPESDMPESDMPDESLAAHAVSP